MKKILLSLTLILLTSCSSTVDKQYVNAMNEYLEVNTPQYQKYLREDKALDETQKQAAINASQEALELSRERKERLSNE